MEQLGPFVVGITFFICIAVVIISLSNNRLKKKMIEMGHVDENAIKLFGKSMNYQFNSLKWGLILFFGGLGLIIISLFPDHLHDTPLPFGIEIIMISLGFLTYYFLMRNKKEI